MRVRSFLFITVFLLCHAVLWPQTLTKKLPPPRAESQTSSPISSSTRAAQNNTAVPVNEGLASFPAADPAMPAASSDPALPDAPVAELVAPPQSGVPVRIEAAQQEKHGSIYTLRGEVAIYYKSYILRADTITFNQDTSEAEADGHLQLEGGVDDELITADRGTLNLDQQTGHLYNVVGTIGVRALGHRKMVYTTANPFIFTGRELVKGGPQRYTVIGGTMTSCRLPRPDWRILSSVIQVDDKEAHARNSSFNLLGVPILYLPYVTHPVNATARQSGLLIPTFGTSSTKGTVLGDSFYLVLGRSMDAVLGTEYFSMRGWSPSGQFRYHGRGEDFARLHFIALFDRGLPPTKVNQGGQDIVFEGRRDFDLDEHLRAVATAEYLSSYVYRLAFAESFAQAVASQVTSSGFVTHNGNGVSESLRLDRYQNFESSNPVSEIRILHVPSIDVDTVDRQVLSTPLAWGLDGSVAGLSRSERNFSSSSEIMRVDLYPHLTLPLVLGGWTLRPEVGARDTFYSKSQNPTTTVPLERNATVDRKDLEAGFELRPPVLVRDFNQPWVERLLGGEVRHTIEPQLRYRYVTGVGNFSSILRFDTTDVVSDTNETEYSLTQHLFVKRKKEQPCASGELPAPADGHITIPVSYTECGGNSSEWLTWRVAAKYFFNPTFGGAVTPLRRNVLASTLDFTGVAFLGGPRDYSPIISRLNLRTSEHTAVEWDADYDSKAGRLDASNVFADYRYGNWVGSVGHSRLDALNPTFTRELASQVTKYNEIRMLIAYGYPTKRGLSAAANAGYDYSVNALQYGAIQTSYNWDCCGLSVEYRRFALGSVRNENQYRFNFTLAGVGTAGNLNRAERIF